MGFRVRGFRASRNLEDLGLREGGCERERERESERERERERDRERQRETEREKILHP